VQKEKFFMAITKESHPGNMPTRVLKYNIADRFENLRPEIKTMQYDDAINKKKISREILVLMDKKSIKSPFANCRTNQIILSEPFIAFLWIIVYYFFNINEHIQYRMLRNNWNGYIDLEDSFIKRSSDLFKWGLTLRYRFTDWDLKLPNPDLDNSNLLKEELNIIGKINNIFLNSISYIMLHEYAHIVNKHCDLYNKIRVKKNLDKIESSLLHDLEKEADNFAFDSIIKEYDDNNYRMLKGLSIVLAHISILFLLKDPNGLIQQNHPDADVRLLTLIDKLALETEKSQFYIKSLIGIACNTFFNLHSIKLKEKDYETVEDQIADYLKILDNIKYK
jgi:hypothetical protein